MSDTLATSVPQTQKAWLAIRRGEPSYALRLDNNVPVSSKLENGEVLVKVQAAALNPVDHKKLKLLPTVFSGRPHVISHDFAGIVLASSDSKIKQGDEVFGTILPNFQNRTHQGALSQFARAPTKTVALRPMNITPTQAAGLAVVCLTAYNALFDVAKLEPGQSLFVSGGITATASGKNEELVKSLGTDVFIDYTKGPVHETLEHNAPTPKFHVILEAAGILALPLWTHSEAYLTPGGTFVSVGPQPDGAGEIPILIRYIWEAFIRPTWLGGVKRKWRLCHPQEKQEQLEHIAKLISEGKFKSVVDSVYDFDDALKAFEHVMTKRARGKVIVKVDPSAD
ncbi:unnamed protein product [Somion occarium]|uniref:Enoyl reductase (ER) domain-containing protein n=1 Tax=Somion occarium TaxID=3059160 RepID=A0ABP1D8I6_9APHY